MDIVPSMDWEQDVCVTDHGFLMWIHAARERGLTTAIRTTILRLQDLGQRYFDAAVVLTERDHDMYLRRGFPEALVLSGKRVPSVLRALISIQQQRRQTTPGGDISWIVLALDDVWLPAAKDLKNPGFLHDLRTAGKHNIAIVIGTTYVKLIPADMEAIATHVMTSQVFTADEPKQLCTRLFKMLAKKNELEDLLFGLQPYQFLLGNMRVPATTSTADTLSTTRGRLHTFVADVYADDASDFEPRGGARGSAILLPESADARPTKRRVTFADMASVAGTTHHDTASSQASGAGAGAAAGAAANTGNSILSTDAVCSLGSSTTSTGNGSEPAATAAAVAAHAPASARDQTADDDTASVSSTSSSSSSSSSTSSSTTASLPSPKSSSRGVKDGLMFYTNPMLLTMLAVTLRS